MLPKMISAFFGFSTPGWVIAESTMRTSPTVLASVIFSSCCLFSSCMYTCWPDSTSRVRRTISCWVFGIAVTRLLSFDFSSSSAWRFSSSVR
ncbi:hypothetical protein D3C81_1665480 [compost metagenome]